MILTSIDTHLTIKTSGITVILKYWDQDHSKFFSAIHIIIVCVDALGPSQTISVILGRFLSSWVKPVLRKE